MACFATIEYWPSQFYSAKCAGVLAWGRSMANESTEVRALRDKFRGDLGSLRRSRSASWAKVEGVASRRLLGGVRRQVGRAAWAGRRD